MVNVKNIIFDLGGVLIDWNPDYIYRKLIVDESKRKWFLDHVCNLDWNEQQDGGRMIEEAVRERISLFPEYKDLILAYYDRWEEMLKGPIDGTVEIFRLLKTNKELGFYALTNWSAETFPRALEIFEFLHWFDGRIVSGEEKTRKPFRKIYELIISRFNLVATETLFIDDNLRNIKAAEEFGIKCIHFIEPDQLKKELKMLNLL